MRASSATIIRSPTVHIAASASLHNSSTRVHQTTANDGGSSRRDARGGDALHSSLSSEGNAEASPRRLGSAARPDTAAALNHVCDAFQRYHAGLSPRRTLGVANDELSLAQPNPLRAGGLHVRIVNIHRGTLVHLGHAALLGSLCAQGIKLRYSNDKTQMANARMLLLCREKPLRLGYAHPQFLQPPLTRCTPLPAV